MNVAINEIQNILREILDTHPTGMAEHDLLKALAGRNVGFLDEDYFNSTLGLFQRHFLLFHCLYLLRDKLRAAGQGDMTIHCLGIRLMPYHNTSSSHPALPDPLAGYYLDLDNLKSTAESDVLRMLDDFWKGFAGEGQRDEALTVMELAHPTTYPEIKRQYRRLAMQWHPDRGGASEQFQRLEWAMGVLRVLYRS